MRWPSKAKMNGMLIKAMNISYFDWRSYLYMSLYIDTKNHHSKAKVAYF